MSASTSSLSIAVHDSRYPTGIGYLLGWDYQITDGIQIVTYLLRTAGSNGAVYFMHVGDTARQDERVVTILDPLQAQQPYDALPAHLVVADDACGHV